ncbi:MAG: hypothetical protein A3F24_00440 [Candidatus Colwellbacteria bacterium RIFCSPHIGHO2_12_FULL_44_17]|uniref:Peptidase M16 n=1 Tax=Candidatus Colwellbacteria bacterium RIFCSPHIGHO2_12_FULL_44_17 TaxID=1797689 RepID=A0A1G1Z4C9_9BACT|nr:MAG: hypothetical protein A3F24_00440 [Candidatus Colwellbacteria bacterium RIFCSPHIGHO2_12_FULL_44_17]
MNFRKQTLANGLRLITVPIAGSLTTTVLVLVEAGSEYETKEINGLSHFLEHMCFKGTKTRPSSQNISKELDTLGAHYNAFTSDEMTGYYATIAKENTDKAIEIISDIYLNSLLKEEDIDKERGPIIEEINMREDDPGSKVWELWPELLYGDQPAGWKITGSKESVKMLKREDFLRYFNKRYIAENTVVVIAGDIDEVKVTETVNKFWEKVQRGMRTQKPKTIESQSEPRILLKYKQLDQTHLKLGVRAYTITDPRRFPAGIIMNILGGKMSSRLWLRIREEMGVAYYVHSDYDFDIDHGYIAIAAGVSNEKLEAVVKVILEEFKRLKTEKLTDKELEEAKSNMIGRLAISIETPEDWADFYGNQEIMTGSIMSPEERMAKIRKVTVEDIQTVANDLFKDEKLNLVLIGPHKDQEPLKTLLKLG